MWYTLINKFEHKQQRDSFLLSWVFETESHSVLWIVLDVRVMVIFLLLPPKFWNYRYEPRCLARTTEFFLSKSYQIGTLLTNFCKYFLRRKIPLLSGLRQIEAHFWLLWFLWIFFWRTSKRALLSLPNSTWLFKNFLNILLTVENEARNIDEVS